MSNNSALLALILAGCVPASERDSSAPTPAADHPVMEIRPSVVPLTGTQWRLESLGGRTPVGGVRPVLIFTGRPAVRDLFDRPLGDEYAGWSLLRGEGGVGPLHVPYRLEGDSLRIAATYEYTRASSAAEEAQARALAVALVEVRRLAHDNARLALLDAAGDTLATFAADPPRRPGPLDDLEWDLVTIGGAPIRPDTRGTLTFSSRPIGPGPSDGFDQFGGYSGCNLYGGGYRLEGDRLMTDGEVISTERGCAASVLAQESAFHRALHRARYVRRDEERLVMLDSLRSELLRFRLHPARDVDAAALRRGRWRFAATNNPHAPSGAAFEVAFADSTYEGAAGCRRFWGDYHLRGDDFSVSSMQTDDAGCSAAGAAAPFWVPIQSGEVAVSQRRVVLYDEDGHETTLVRP